MNNFAEKVGLLCMLGLIILMSGCSEQLDRWAIEQAIEQCELNGGVDYIVVHENSDEYVMCQNSWGGFIKKAAELKY